MLGLKLATDPRWVNLAEKSLEEILTDHAYCEQKAASSCISLIQQFPDKTEMVESLAPVVTEEWGHFRLVLQKLAEKNLKLGFQRNDEYVNQLIQFQIKGGTREQRFIDRLLICAMIEARSCERFRLLSLHLKEQELREFYHTFMVSEAGHYRLFLELAKNYGEPETVQTRWQQLLEFEAKILDAFALRGDRMH
ncbi:MAG: tRNA-(ms[2]io[6]A)-hydroxylase [Saprospiraceae bacterium]|nr:tRNA-(ms[2]io[6]A)-hydroxylase [Saprospiraceae bacterium]